jgi:hypothetical protein
MCIQENPQPCCQQGTLARGVKPAAAYIAMLEIRLTGCIQEASLSQHLRKCSIQQQLRRYFLPCEGEPQGGSKYMTCTAVLTEKDLSKGLKVQG